MSYISYKTHKWCRKCGEWKSKQILRCDVCNQKLRTVPQTKRTARVEDAIRY